MKMAIVKLKQYGTNTNFGIINNLTLMKKNILLTILAFLLFSSSGVSYAYTVVGGYKCGSLLSEDRKNNQGTKTHVIGWFEGYITALNSTSNEDQQALPDNDDSVYYYLVKYCRDYPMSDTVDAADALYLKLLGF
jgi:hypothetical protein